jgi:hypothetical protein
VGADSEEQSNDEAGNGKRTHNAQSAAGGGDFRAGTEDQLRDVAALCAERHANGDLLLSLRNAKGDDGVNAHGCQE